MSSFLSAAENVARQRQKARLDLKRMEEGSRAVKLALETHNLFIFGLCCTGNMFQLQCLRQFHLYFWYHCDAVDA